MFTTILDCRVEICIILYNFVFVHFCNKLSVFSLSEFHFTKSISRTVDLSSTYFTRSYGDMRAEGKYTTLTGVMTLAVDAPGNINQLLMLLLICKTFREFTFSGSVNSQDKFLIP